MKNHNLRRFFASLRCLLFHFIVVVVFIDWDCVPIDKAKKTYNGWERETIANQSQEAQRNQLHNVTRRFFATSSCREVKNCTHSVDTQHTPSEFYITFYYWIEIKSDNKTLKDSFGKEKWTLSWNRIASEVLMREFSLLLSVFSLLMSVFSLVLSVFSILQWVFSL